MLCISVRLMAIDNTIVNAALPAAGPFLRRLRELAAGAHSPVRSEIKDFGPGRS